MKRFKIVCSDLDGTLLDNKSQISEENIKAINTLMEKGVYFVPSTGRAESEIPKEIRDISAIRFMICSGGAVLLDRENKKSYLTCMSNETVRKVFSVLENYEVHPCLRFEGVCYADKAQANEAAYRYYNVSEPHIRVLSKHCSFREDFKEFALTLNDVEVIAVFFHTEEQMEDCEKRLKAIEELSVVRSFECNLEIMNKNAGKGNALKTLCSLLNVSKEETLSLGDSENDSSIIKAAGLGLAVSNACETLKNMADEIICSNEEHAARFVLERYF